MVDSVKLLYNKIMKLGYALVLVVLIIVGGLFVISLVDNNDPVLEGANLPDRCEIFDQAASRSIAEVVKSAPGKVYSVRASGMASIATYVQLFDRTSEPASTVSADISLPIPAATASSSPQTIEYIPPAPIDFSTGITFALSSSYGTYASTSVQSSNFMVNICYY